MKRDQEKHKMYFPSLCLENFYFYGLVFMVSETQGQIVGARESLNGRKNKPRRKVKNFEKSRLLYIMLAFFEHFSEAKALSIIRAF